MPQQIYLFSGCGPGKSSAASVDENGKGLFLNMTVSIQSICSDDTNESTKAKENNRPNKNSDNTQENANKQKVKMIYLSYVGIKLLNL